jgi:acetyl-CoA synthetase (ADP-forming)
VDYFSGIPKTLLEEKNADILLMYFLMPSHTVKRALQQMGLPEEQVTEQTANLISAQGDSIARLLKTHDKPLVGYTFRSLEEQFMRGLLERGVPVFPDPERAARAIKALVEYTGLREKILAGPQSGFSDVQ